ncbi:hypothetical protein ACH41H_36230 [Streptomyces sp. NPDC020800]|uniref:hypothetical protein n=1 Tax=Streptomyces sp. NPDC020800 TaxID=3365092 RepID=UPI0037B3E8CD
MTRIWLRTAADVVLCVVTGGIATLGGVLSAIPFHGATAVGVWIAVGLTLAIAFASLGDRLISRLFQRLDRTRTDRAARDFHESIGSGLTESFDDFSTRLDQAGPDTTWRP